MRRAVQTQLGEREYEAVKKYGEGKGMGMSGTIRMLVRERLGLDKKEGWDDGKGTGEGGMRESGGG
jgi:hypothetical protein